MPLTLREAMQLVEPLRKSRVLAGERGLDNIVQSVNVMEVPDILEWVHEGQLLVTTMYPLRDSAAAIETLVPRLAEKRLAGLAVTPSDYIEEFSKSMVDSANALDFPLIELPKKVSFIDIIQPITSQILKLQANELLESEEIHRQFIDLVLSGGTYGNIAQGISQRLKIPVTVVDRFRRVLGDGFIIGHPQTHKDFIREEVGGDRYLNSQYQPRIKSEILGSKAVLKEVDGPKGTIEHIVCPVMVGPMRLGDIIVWGTLTEPPKSIELIAIEHGTTVAALKMMEMRSIGEVEDRFRNEILRGLLSGQPADRKRAIQLSNEQGSRLLPPYAVIVVGSDYPAGTSLTKVQSIEQRNIGSSLHLVTRYIRSNEPETSYWYHGARLVVFYPFSMDKTPNAKSLFIQKLRKICERIKTENSPYTVSMGVSSITFGLDDFRVAFENAKRSLEFGYTLQEKAGNLVTPYEDIGLLRVISMEQGPHNLERYCRDTLGPLLTYDRENDTDLTETLRTFLEQSQNLTKTSKILYIHYNTLRYRLERIKEIIGDSLDNPQSRLAIEVALHLYPLIDRSFAVQENES